MVFNKIVAEKCTFGVLLVRMTNSKEVRRSLVCVASGI